MDFQSYDELFPGRFLKAGLFNGQAVTYTIADIRREELESERGPEPKIIMSFQETPLQLVLAKVNAEAIKAMFGPSVPGWVGKRITLYGTTSIMPYPKRKNEPCIRVYGSPDISEVVRCEWTPPRRRPVVQMLQPVASPTLTRALEAVARAATDEERQAIVARARALNQGGQLTDAELHAVVRAASPEPAAQPSQQAQPEPAPQPAAQPEPEPEPPAEPQAAAAPEPQPQPEPSPAADAAPGEEDMRRLTELIKSKPNGRQALADFMAARQLAPRTPLSKAVATQADLNALLEALG